MRRQLTSAFAGTAAFLLLGATLANCQSTQAQPVPDEWDSGLHVDHELVGQIWLTTENRFVSRDELISLLSQSDILLLGEKHDNPDHHRLRHELLQSLISDDEQSLLVMEMMTPDQQAAIDEMGAEEPLPDTEEWPQLLAWDEAWTWAYYQPAIALALQYDSRLLAGNISTEQMMQIYRATEPAGTDQTLNVDQLARLAQEIDSSHCGMLPETQIPAMVRVQQARDQQMAETLMSPGDFKRRILLAGNYHIRYDLSVPNYLPETGADLRIRNLAFLEVNPGLTKPADYLADADGQPVYDFVWFTPAVRSDDYCADLAP